MVVLRHLAGSDPEIEVTDEEMGGDAARTVHFRERRPNAALDVEQDARSVVVHDMAIGSSGSDPAEVTQVTRQMREPGHGTWSRCLIWAETHWIAIMVAMSLLALLICAVRLKK